jgi:hypothetical protein
VWSSSVGRAARVLISLLVIGCTRGAAPSRQSQTSQTARTDRRTDSVLATLAGAEQAPAGQAAATPMRTCGGSATTLCFTDTAFVHEDSGADDPIPEAHWVWFARASDSLQVTAWQGNADGGRSASIVAVPDPVHTEGPVSVVDRRLPTDGVLQIFVSLSDVVGASPTGDTVPYTFRVARVGGAQTPWISTGAHATLHVLGSGARPFTIIPVSEVPKVTNRAAWGVMGTRFRVALARDTLYEVCNVPCRKPDTLRITSGAQAEWVRTR